jgi:ubiquinone biosynthesis UbiH/UbiF/VisC/COQ6 family hydroxylase
MTTETTDTDFDIVITGAGPAGLSLASSLAGSDLRTLVVEQRSMQDLRNPAPDGRDIALTHLSRQLLEQIGVWQRLPAATIHPIRKAQVLDGTSPYVLDFDNAKFGVDALGFLVANHDIRRALIEQALTLADTEIRTDTVVTGVQTDDHAAHVQLSGGQTVRTALLVAADSRFSQTRRWMGISADMHDFGRVAIVCRMEHERDNQGIAFECFHYGRTLAVLPLQPQLASIVVTVSSEQADDILAQDEDTFSADIRQRFDDRLGEMQLVGERHAYPLVAVHANRFVARRFALVGDAAVGMHPVTAHGFNLGLRGQATLAAEIRRARTVQGDIGAPAVLERYQSTHRRVTRPLYAGTNHLVGLFTDDRPPARLLRKLALRFGNHCPPVKRMIANQLIEPDAAKNLFLRLPFLR